MTPALLRFHGEALAVLSGILLALSFPKLGHGALAWVALAPLLVALDGAASRAQGLRLGYLTGATSALGILYWTAPVAMRYGGLSLPVGILVMALVCLVTALFPSLFGWTVVTWRRQLGHEALLAAPVAWVATEILRAHMLFDFSWCLLGYSQHANLPVLQTARYAAVYGVSFLVASGSAVGAYLAVARQGRRRLVAAGVLAVVLVAVWAHGLWRLGRPVPEAGRIRVGLVQPSILPADGRDPDQAGDNVARHLALTQRAAAQGARLVVWPESAVSAYFDHDEGVAQTLRDTARGQRLFLLFGNDDREASPDGRKLRFRVGAKMLDPGGALRLRYHKVRLVPFGEYVPIPSVITLGGRLTARLTSQVSDYTPGAGPVLGEVDGHRVGVFICYEAIFPGLVRGFAGEGAELLVNVTNDAWFGRTAAPYQHMAMAVFRAVESGTYLVRAANTGITAVVDPHGRVLRRTELFQRTVLVADVPFAPAGTFYTRHGDLFAWGCLAVSVGVTAALRPWSRRP